MNSLDVLLKKDLRALRNLRVLAREQSVFKGIVITVFAVGILEGMFLMFLDALRFLGSLGGIGVMIIQHLFGFFFFGLGIMLVLSNIITAYAVYFRSADVPFLLQQPISRGVIAIHKHLESALLSSWAFFLIIIPFVGAYAWHQKLSLSFALWTALFSIPFVFLCAGIGVIVIMAVVRFMPRFRRWWLLAVVALGIAAYFAFALPGGPEGENDDMSFLLASLVPGIRLASFPLWPSWWVSEGIMAMARANWDRGALLFCVLMANALLAGLVIEWMGNSLFYRAWERLTASGTSSRSSSTGAFRLSVRLLLFLPSDWRAIILKDARSLLRDPVQMIQGLLFFGLLGIYFFNLRNMHYHLMSPVWRNLIAFLNLFSLSAIMCSFCSRFVFPQMSMEGHGFWIIGLSPVGMSRILKIKFASAVCAMLAIGCVLMVVSSTMLEVDAQVLLITVAVAVASAFALCGLALGLGACFMDLKQPNPVAIISGFGGTLNLVLSLIYIMLAVIPFGFLCHERVMGAVGRALFMKGMLVCAVWLIAVTALAAFLPLMAGRRSLMAREY